MKWSIYTTLTLKMLNPQQIGESLGGIIEAW